MKPTTPGGHVEVEIMVPVRVRAYRTAAYVRTSGPPDTCFDDEGGEIDDLKATYNGLEIELREEDLREAETLLADAEVLERNE